MDVVEVIRKHGMRPSVMTSAYWARSDVATEKLLTPLVHAGLDGLGVSVDEFHQEKVPLQNVLRAIRTAKRLGLWVGVAFRYYGRDESAKEAACELRDILGEVFEDVDIVNVGPIQKEGQASQQVEFTQQHLEKQGKIINCGPFSPTIWPDGTVSSCCGPRLSERNPLVIGNLNYEPFTEIYQRFREHPIIPFLEVLGLTKMVEELNDNGLGGNLKDFVAPEETCSLCQKMLTNVTYIDFFVKKFRDPAFRRQLGVRRFLLYGNPWPLLSTEGEKERK
jgi:MoaA/NifB/PqqE/SkfB family radical SAM enzyme